MSKDVLFLYDQNTLELEDLEILFGLFKSQNLSVEVALFSETWSHASIKYWSENSKIAVLGISPHVSMRHNSSLNMFVQCWVHASAGSTTKPMIVLRRSASASFVDLLPESLTVDSIDVSKGVTSATTDSLAMLFRVRSITQSLWARSAPAPHQYPLVPLPPPPQPQPQPASAQTWPQPPQSRPQPQPAPAQTRPQPRAVDLGHVPSGGVAAWEQPAPRAPPVKRVSFSDSLQEDPIQPSVPPTSPGARPIGVLRPSPPSQRLEATSTAPNAPLSSAWGTGSTVQPAWGEAGSAQPSERATAAKERFGTPQTSAETGLRQTRGPVFGHLVVPAVLILVLSYLVIFSRNMAPSTPSVKFPSPSSPTVEPPSGGPGTQSVLTADAGHGTGLAPPSPIPPLTLFAIVPTLQQAFQTQRTTFGALQHNISRATTATLAAEDYLMPPEANRAVSAMLDAAFCLRTISTAVKALLDAYARSLLRVQQRVGVTVGPGHQLLVASWGHTEEADTLAAWLESVETAERGLRVIMEEIAVLRGHVRNAVGIALHLEGLILRRVETLVAASSLSAHSTPAPSDTPATHPSPAARMLAEATPLLGNMSHLTALVAAAAGPLQITGDAATAPLGSAQEQLQAAVGVSAGPDAAVRMAQDVEVLARFESQMQQLQTRLQHSTQAGTPAPDAALLRDQAAAARAECLQMAHEADRRLTDWFQSN